MKSYKELLNENALGGNLRQLTEEESAQLKKVLLEMYQALASVCMKHGLTLMLCGGSCLGAIRHQGFIPWDDDLDVCMLRRDYEQLKRLLQEGGLGEEYDYLFPSASKDALCMFMKIYRKGTLWVEIGNEYTDFPKNLCIDVFPVDGVSDHSFVRSCVGMLANGLRLCANMVYEASYPVSEATESLAKGGAGGRMMKCRRMLGHLLKIVGHRHWVNAFDRLVRCEKMTRLLSIPTGRKLYKGETLPAEVFWPPRKSKFEGVEVYVPGKPELYLENLYGKDYRQLPPPEKRERHFIVEFALNSD